MTSPGPASIQERRSNWLRQICSFPSMLMAILFVFAYILARGQVNEPDIWWHLRNAERLFQEHRIPDVDTYSFTVAGHPWMNHQWLAEIPYYLSWRAAGIVGIEVLSILLIEALFAGLLVLCYESSRNIKASAAACFFVAYLTVVSYGPRTVLFGYLHLVILLILLERFRARGGPLWPIPILFCSWINMHGLWLMGLVVFGIFSASGLFEVRFGNVVSQRWSPQELRKLLWTGLASTAALFVNPFGWRLVYYPFNLAFEQQLVKSAIAEWASVNFHDVQGKMALAVLLAFFIAALARNRSWRLSDVGLLFVGVYCGLTYIRLLCLFAVIAAPILARLLDFIPPYRQEIDKPVFNVLIVALVIAGTLAVFPPLSRDNLETLIAKEYPVAIQGYLKEHPLRGGVLNLYLWGGYLIWHNRDAKVFIDGRADIFEYTGVMKEYGDLVHLQTVDPTIEKYGVRYVLFSPDHPLTYVLTHDPRWKEQYRDDVSVLLERVK